MQIGSLRYQMPLSLESRVQIALGDFAPARLRPRRAAWPWIAIAAGILLATFFVARWPLGLQPVTDNLVAQEILDSHLRSLQPGHLTDVQSSDRHTVKPWFDGKTDFSPPVEDFASQGYPLIGGRLDSIAGRTVAGLVYQRNRHLISVYLWPLAATPDAAPTTSTRQGYNVIHWTTSGMDYWAVSDLNTEELQTLVNLLRGAR